MTIAQFRAAQARIDHAVDTGHQIDPDDLYLVDHCFTCSYCGSDSTECRQAAMLGEHGAPCGA